MKRLLVAVAVAVGALVPAPAAQAMTSCVWGLNQASRFVAAHGYVPYRAACAFDSPLGQRALARAYGEYLRSHR